MSLYIKPLYGGDNYTALACPGTTPSVGCGAMPVVGGRLPPMALFRRPEPAPVVRGADESLVLILEEARRALVQQQSDLNALRDRAGNLLQFAAITAAFLGGLTLRGKATLTDWTYAGATSFVVLSVVLIFVLLPRHFTFTNNAKVMLETWDLKKGPDYVAKHLARWLQTHYETNQKRIDRMTVAYIAAIVALAAEVSLLFIDLVRR
jgi:hypothetical protein